MFAPSVSRGSHRPDAEGQSTATLSRLTERQRPRQRVTEGSPPSDTHTVVLAVGMPLAHVQGGGKGKGAGFGEDELVGQDKVKDSKLVDGEAHEGGDQVAGEEDVGIDDVPIARPKALPKHRRTCQVSRLKVAKGGAHRWAPWKELTVDFERDQPWLVIKKDVKVNLTSYALSEWQDKGVDADLGVTAVLGEGWEDVGAHCVLLRWNGLGWRPEVNEINLLFPNNDQRDHILHFMVPSPPFPPP